MAITLQGNSRVVFDTIYKNTKDLGTATGGLKQTFSQAWTNGGGDDQGDMLFHDSRTGTETLDLISGLTDEFGQAIVFTKIKELYLRNTGLVDSGNDITLTGDFLASIGIASFPLTPQGVLHVASPESAGWPVSGPSTHEIILTGAFPYDIVLIGSTS